MNKIYNLESRFFTCWAAPEEARRREGAGTAAAAMLARALRRRGPHLAVALRPPSSKAAAPLDQLIKSAYEAA